MKESGDLQLLKRINRSALLRLVRNHPGISRARLADTSGLTKSTVSGLVRELLDTDWLTEGSSTVAADRMGRPSTPLHINSQRRVLMGIEIAVERLRLVCVALDGTIRLESEVALLDRDPQRACAQMVEEARAMHAQVVAQQWLLTGIGVCLPGALDESAGIVRLAPNLGWRNVPFLRATVSALDCAGICDVPIYIQNDADAAALSEFEFGAQPAQEPLIFINCDVGVGAGVVLNDHVFSGHTGSAGEVGHTILQVDGPLCSCGRRGCAETFLGSRAIARHNDIERAGRYLGVLMQNLDAMFNPRVIVIGGRSAVESPHIVRWGQETLQRYAQEAGLQAPQVRAARYGLQAAAVGAATLALHRFMRPLLKDVPHASWH